MTLPTGTVTFLFTDIEGSTRLMQELGERYPEAQAAHHAILRDAFAGANGRELRTEGDSFFCVFASARDACTAAVTAQKSLAAQEWPEGAAIRVRMGLHTGEAPLVGDEYVGIDVHHAARVSAAAHGGQILLSDATRALVEANLPTSVTLRDLGTHRLKDLVRSERLYQLVIDGLPDQFPPLGTLEAIPNNLPTQLTSFVGRGALVAEVKRLLEHVRLLTLTGPGGVGKTRLSLQVAAEVGSEFPDGVFFVPLSAVSEPGLVPSSIAQLLALPVSGSLTPMEVLVEYLRNRNLLLVLDNFEQLLPEAASIVTGLLQSSPGLKVLVSSRIVLRVYGEQEFSVEPMRVPDVTALADLETVTQYEAVRLFIERAVAVKRDFQITNQNAPAVAGICERVDGLPLAIELAAARVKLFSPQALLSRLETSLGMLVGGARDLPSRQQTLQGAIAWSYDLLDEPHRRLFARFSVFARGANLEQAEKVCQPDDEGIDVLTGLDELADHSLLRRIPDVDEPRLLMLVTIREFAFEKLRQSGEEEAIRDRHARAFGELADDALANIFGHDQKMWLDLLERDHDNFRAALDWCVTRSDVRTALNMAASLWRFWQMRGHLQEGRARLDSLLTMFRDEEPAARVRALEAAGGIAYWQGDPDAAELYYGEYLELARSLGDRRTIADALYNYSFPKVVTKQDPAGAKALLEEALAIFRDLGDEPGTARCLLGLGLADFYLEDFGEAKSYFDDTMSLSRRLGDQFLLGWSLFLGAIIAIQQSDPEPARAPLREALRTFAQAEDVSGIVLVINAMSVAARLEGNTIRAARLAGIKAAHESASGAGLVSLTNVVQGWDLQGELSAAELAAHREGEAMDIKRAVAYALETSPSPTLADRDAMGRVQALHEGKRRPTV